MSDNAMNELAEAMAQLAKKQQETEDQGMSEAMDKRKREINEKEFLTTLRLTVGLLRYLASGSGENLQTGNMPLNTHLELEEMAKIIAKNNAGAEDGKILSGILQTAADAEKLEKRYHAKEINLDAYLKAYDKLLDKLN